MTKKILVKIWEPALTELNRMTNEAGLKRDYFLNNVFKHEAQMLKKEVPNPNSERVKKYISSELIKNSLKPVNLLLEAETIDEINNACKEKNIPRDAFINRVILLLTATSEVLGNLFFYRNYNDCIIDAMECGGADGEGAEYYASYSANIIDTITEFVNNDPFWLLRSCLEMESETDSLLHNISFNELFQRDISNKIIDFSNIHIHGFNCYISDDEIDFLTSTQYEYAKRVVSELNDKEKSRKADRDKLQNKLINSGDKN